MTKPVIQILMIEDNEPDALLLAEILSQDALNSFEITISNRLKTGLETLQHRAFNLILLDLGLPDSQGLETFERVHTEAPDLPVVVLSGLLDERLALQAVHAGAQDYLVKGPTSWEIAPRAIRHAIERQRMRMNLQVSEAKHRLLFENAPIGILSITPQGRITDVNAAALQILGSPSAEATKSINLLTFPPLIEAGISADFQSRLENARPISAERPYKTNWGKSIVVKYQLTPVVNEKGKIILVQVILEDITERKQAEEALRQSEARYRALFQNSPISIWEQDFSQVKTYLDTLKRQGITDFGQYFADHPEAVFECAEMIRVLDVNYAGLKMYKAKTKDDLFKSTHEELSPGEMEHLHEDLIAIAEGRTSYGWEGKDETLTGEPIEISLSWSVPPGYEQDFSKVIVTTIDITERKRAEKALNESEERFRLLYNTSIDAVLLTVPDGTTLAANPAACRLFGRTEEELQRIGRAGVVDLTDPRLAEALDERARTGHFSGELTFVRADGTKFPAEISSAIFKDKDGRERTSMLIRDISDRKRAERLLIAFNRSAQAMAGASTPDEVLSAASTQLKEVGLACIVLPLDSGSDRYVARYLSIPPGLLHSLEKLTGIKHEDFSFPIDALNVFQQVRLENRAVLVKDAEPLVQQVLPKPLKGLAGRIVKALHAPKYIAAPMMVDDIFVGVFAAQSDDLTEQDIPAITAFAHHVAIALRKAELFQQAQNEIADRRQAEKELRSSEARYRNLFENMLNGFAYCQMLYNGDKPNDFIYLEVNNAFGALTGLNDVIGKRVTEVIPGVKEATPELFEIYAKVAETGIPEQFEIDFTPLNIWLDISVYSPQKGFFVAVFENITERKRVEETLRESEEKYRLLFENAPVGVFQSTPEGRYISVNPTLTRLFQYASPEEMTAQVTDIARQIHVDEARREIFKNVLAEKGEIKEFVNQNYRRDGSIIWTLTNARAVKDKSGSIQYYEGFMSDITEGKLAEEALQKSERKFKTLFEIAPAGISVIDRDHNILDANYSLQRITGLNRDELLNGAYRNRTYLRPDGSTMPFDEFASTRAAREEMPIFDIETGIVTEDRGVVWTQVSAAPLGTPEGSIVIITQDITSRKQAEEALRDSEEKYRLLVENATVGIVIAQDQTLRYINPKAMELVGYSREEMLSIDFAERIHPDDRDETIGYYIKFLQGEETPANYIFRIIDKAGSTKWIDSNAVLVMWEGRPASMNFLMEITERKHAEDELRTSQMRYQGLFENSPISIWEEDFSQVKVFLDQLHSTGVGDFQKYFDDHPEAVRECSRLVKISDVNRATLKLMECNAKGELLKELSYSLSNEALESFKQELVSFAKGNLYFESEEVVEARTGVKKDVLIQVNVLPGFEATLGKVLVSIIDISERKRSEEALLASEKKYRTLHNTMADGFVSVDMKGRILDANFSYQEITGYSLDELQQRTYLDLTPARWHQMEREIVEKQVIPRGYSDIYEKEYQKKDGSICPIELHTFLIKDESGVAEGMWAIVRDITERKRTEQTLRQRLAELETLYESGLSLNQLLEPKEIGQKIIDVLAEKLDWYHTTIRLYHPESNSLELLAFNLARKTTKKESLAMRKRFETLIARPGDGLSGWVLQHGETVRCSDVTSDPHYMEAVPGLQSGLYVPIKTGDRTIGVISVESEKPNYFSAEDEHLAVTLAAQAAVALENIRLFKDLQRSNEDLFLAYDETIEGWSHALDLRDRETEGHTLRVTELTVKLAQQMGIPEAEIVHIRRGALLHDIGKMGVPDRILLKPDKLADEEWTIMRMHPVHAYNLLSRIAFLRSALNVPHYHHEKWDGSGYPDGLSGKKIPLEARIFAVIDVYDALTSDRPYRPGWPEGQAIQYIQQQSGSHFDPQVVGEFLRLIKGK